MCSAKSGHNLWQIWHVFDPWASPFGANGQMTMTVHNYRPRQFYRTLNWENPSSGYRDMSSGSLAAARPPKPWRQYPSSPETYIVTPVYQGDVITVKKIHLKMSAECLHQKNWSHLINYHSLLAAVPRVLEEHRNIPPLSEPIRKVVLSAGLADTQVTPISWSPRLARIRMERGNASVNRMKLR